MMFCFFRLQYYFCCALLVLVVTSIIVETTTASSSEEYGVDVSFPIHHSTVSQNYAWLDHNTEPYYYETPKEFKNTVIQPLGNRQEFYDEFLQGCIDYYGKKGRLCVETESGRVAMSLRQPQSMQNYTENGFKKIKTPEPLWSLIREFWETNKDKESVELWGPGNTYTNHWKSPTYMVSVEDRALEGGGYQFKQQIWDAAKETIQEWTGEELTQCSLYGIRIYKENAVLATHVDRLPLVSSAIINVDSDLDEPWPLEVIGHDGKATNVTMVPGDMVLYESHSVLHGRPFPLKGKFVANLFVHFEPTGHSLRHHNHDGSTMDTNDATTAGHENNDHSGLPPYLIPGTPEEPVWRRTHPKPIQRGSLRGSNNNDNNNGGSFTTGSTTFHQAAQVGDLETVQYHVENKKHDIDLKDSNGWTALHEATRAGHTDVVKFLIENGANVSGKTNDGSSVLYVAKQEHGEDHPIIDLLEEAGALFEGPDL